MSTILLLLAGVTAGDGPRSPSAETTETFRLVGDWRGEWRLEDGKRFPARLSRDGCVVGRVPGEMRVLDTACIRDEGEGKFFLDIAGRVSYLGIYRRDEDRVILCFRKVSQRRPASFQGGDGQHLIVLRRFPPGR